MILVQLDGRATKPLPQTEQTFTYLQQGLKFLIILCPLALLIQRKFKLDSTLTHKDCVITHIMLSVTPSFKWQTK